MRTILSIFALTLFIGTAAAAPSPVEARKIEHLIAAVEQLRDAKFIRNGTAYDASKAADHLRLKLREAGERVENAEDFIPCAPRAAPCPASPTSWCSTTAGA
ncbi:MAG: DUF5329 family protein [Burkholderiales bacterium]